MFIYFDDNVGKQRIRQDYMKRVNISENVFTNRIYFIEGKVRVGCLTEINFKN